MKTREKIIERYVLNKTALDIGCVSNQKKGHFQFGRLHEFLRKKCSSVKGLDINRKGVEQLRRNGYDIIFGNAETFNIPEKFDVIVAGEIIEHLENQGAFLRTAWRHLKKEGKIIITTPNSFALRTFLRNVLGVLEVNKEHTLWHDKNTLTRLVERCGFKVEKIAFTFDDTYKLKSKIEQLLCFKKSLRPQMVMIARKK